MPIHTFSNYKRVRDIIFYYHFNSIIIKMLITIITKASSQESKQYGERPEAARQVFALLTCR